MTKIANSLLLPVLLGTTSAAGAGGLTHLLQSDLTDPIKRRNRALLAALLGGTAGATGGHFLNRGIAQEGIAQGRNEAEIEYADRFRQHTMPALEQMAGAIKAYEPSVSESLADPFINLLDTKNPSLK